MPDPDTQVPDTREFFEDSSQKNALNNKLLFDRSLHDVFAAKPYPSAWEQLALEMAHNSHSRNNLIANNVAAFCHAVNMGSLLSAQAGVTEAQQTVSPIRTGAADTQAQQPAGAVYPPIRNVDQAGATATNVVQTAMSSIAGQIAALTDIVTKLADALVPAVVAAAGNAGSTGNSGGQTRPTT